MTDLSSLIERVKSARKQDNALDVLIDVALFEPDEECSSVRANAAGTKLVFSYRSGKSQTFRARDWTLDKDWRRMAIERLTALEAKNG